MTGTPGTEKRRYLPEPTSGTKIFYPSVLSLWFPPGPSKKAEPKPLGKEFVDEVEAAEPKAKVEGANSATGGGQLCPTLHPFGSAPWPSKNTAPGPPLPEPSVLPASTNPFSDPSAPSPYSRGATELFLVAVGPGGIGPAAWHPWHAQDLKGLRKAVLEDGPNSPWAKTLLRGDPPALYSPGLEGTRPSHAPQLHLS